ncbi:SRPBCC family protein [Halobellus rubicundus]|uniref:SRPBCC family protein n=1 Tax=Halobellus rubicundus TaxID=2996466 RepID=A0ABD5MD44_9EURY
MRRVAVDRTLDTDAATVRSRMADVGPFMRAAGFDEVTHEGTTLHLANEVGPVRIELTLELLGDADAELAYRQREGIFEEMITRYYVTETEAGTRVEAETEFELDVAVVGSFLDATVISAQRRRELTAQLDFLAE